MALLLRYQYPDSVLSRQPTGGLFSSSMILVWLLEANYTLNILVFLYWRQIILGTFLFFFTGGQVADTYHMFTKLYTMLLIICVERLIHIGSPFSLRKWRRRPHFPTKLAAVASFSYKIGGGGKDLATLLAAFLTWSRYWLRYDINSLNDVLSHAVPLA